MDFEYPILELVDVLKNAVGENNEKLLAPSEARYLEQRVKGTTQYQLAKDECLKYNVLLDFVDSTFEPWGSDPVRNSIIAERLHSAAVARWGPLPEQPIEDPMLQVVDDIKNEVGMDIGKLLAPDEVRCLKDYAERCIKTHRALTKDECRTRSALLDFLDSALEPLGSDLMRSDIIAERLRSAAVTRWGPLLEQSTAESASPASENQRVR